MSLFPAAYSQAEIDAIAGWLLEGRTAEAIAERFFRTFRRAVTRNAIIGIVRRNRQLAAIGFARKGKGGKRSRKRAPAAAEAPRAVTLAPDPALPTHETVPDLAPDLAPALLPVRLAAAPARPAGEPMTFLEAMFEDRCLFFAGDPMEPAGPDMPVCGAPRALAPAGTRWCCHHQKRINAPRPGRDETPKRPIVGQWDRAA